MYKSFVEVNGRDYPTMRILWSSIEEGHTGQEIVKGTSGKVILCRENCHFEEQLGKIVVI